MRVDLSQLNRSTGKTILFVTHDIDEALQLADVIAILRDGKLVQFGTPSELLTQPADDFVRDFMGGSGLGLKLLALRHVAERVKPEAVPGEAIAPETTLAEALSQMVLRRTSRLPVRGGADTAPGSIGLSDLVL